MRATSYVQLILKGAALQGSPSPLDYLALKVWDQIRPIVDYFHLKDEVYYRILSNLYTVLSVLLIFSVTAIDMLRRNAKRWVSLLQFSLLFFVPVSFLFTRMVYYYAAEMRPYALWNSLWFVILSLGLLDHKQKKLFTIFLILLALSATASIYQITIMAGAFFIVHYKEKFVLREILKIFGLPFIVSLYYCLKVVSYGYDNQENAWPAFYGLWSHNIKIIPMMLAAVALCYFKRGNRDKALVPLSYLFLFLAGPILFWITQWKGFFYAERQFIYYSLTNAVFLLTCIQCLPAYLESIKTRRMVTLFFIGIVLIGHSTAFRPKFQRKLIHSVKNTLSVFDDFSIISAKKLNYE